MHPAFFVIMAILIVSYISYSITYRRVRRIAVSNSKKNDAKRSSLAEKIALDARINSLDVFRARHIFLSSSLKDKTMLEDAIGPVSDNDFATIKHGVIIMHLAQFGGFVGIAVVMAYFFL